MTLYHLHHLVWFWLAPAKTHCRTSPCVSFCWIGGTCAEWGHEPSVLTKLLTCPWQQRLIWIDTMPKTLVSNRPRSCKGAAKLKGYKGRNRRWRGLHASITNSYWQRDRSIPARDEGFDWFSKLSRQECSPKISLETQILYMGPFLPYNLRLARLQLAVRGAILSLCLRIKSSSVIDHSLLQSHPMILGLSLLRARMARSTIPWSIKGQRPSGLMCKVWSLRAKVPSRPRSLV